MKLLLDTHAFLWFIGGNDRLNAYANALIEDEANDRYLRVASLWEIAMKVGIGKLDVPHPFPRLAQHSMRECANPRQANPR